jgi:glucose-1-phosphate cytidylyltransferase
LQKLAKDRMLAAYRHDGFWQPMDTLQDKHVLEERWKSGEAPWKIWP